MSQDLSVRITQRAFELGCRLQPAHVEQLTRYLHLLARWNGRINLTALPLEGFPAATLDRLLMEPLVAAQQLKTTSFCWLDFGSGGGSPALPLKIVRPETLLTMVESRARKCAFLREAVRQLDMQNAAVDQARVEDVRIDPRSVDLISLRALRLDEAIAKRAVSLLRVGGRLLTFGPALQPLPAPPGFTFQISTPLPGGTSSLHWYTLSN